MREKENMSRGQEDAIAHLNGPCAVIAPPGSGKTFVLVRRIVNLTQEHRVPPEKITVLTFTRAAATQMKERYLTLIGARDTKVVFGTIHAVLLRILRQSLSMGAVPADGCADHVRILSEKEQRQILTQIVNDMGADHVEAPEIEELSAYIRKRKSEKHTYDEENLHRSKRACADEGLHRNEDSGGKKSASPAERIYDAYRSLCRKRGYLDFEDLTQYCLNMLLDERNAGIRAFWQSRIEYLLVDEFQDVSPRQFEAIRLLAKPQDHLFAVGDDDQAIYGFRGADTGLMLHLSEQYERLRLIRLEVNYRCGRRIVSAAGRLIACNRLRYRKEVSAGRSEEGDVRVVICKDRDQQARTIAEALRSIPEKESCAVIVRTNAQADVVRRLAVREGMNCFKKDDHGDRMKNPAVKAAAAYLELAGRAGKYVGETRLAEDMMLTANCPHRAIARHVIVQCGADFQKLFNVYEGNARMQKAVAEWKKQLETLRTLPLLTAIRYIRRGIGLDRALIDLAEGNPYLEKQYAGALDDLEEFARKDADAAERYLLSGKDNENADALREGKFSQEAACAARGAGSKTEGARHREKICVLTMHSAKGLEFDHVIIPDVNEGSIPCKRAFLPEDTEEERRLLYVAMTRAKKSLLMTCVHRQGDQKIQMSRFLREILQSSSSSNNSSNARSSRNSS